MWSLTSLVWALLYGFSLIHTTVAFESCAALAKRCACALHSFACVYAYTNAHARILHQCVHYSLLYAITYTAVYDHTPVSLLRMHNTVGSAHIVYCI
jgi:hypothetical protein